VNAEMAELGGSGSVVSAAQPARTESVNAAANDVMVLTSLMVLFFECATLHRAPRVET
jgi:hypothetical protein